VVDGLAETEEVLKAVLEPRGLRVERIRAHQEGANANRPAPPQLMVLHADDAQSSKLRTGSWADVPCVVIGSARVSSGEQMRDGAHYLQKPFCYRELIRAIEGLLARRAR